MEDLATTSSINKKGVPIKTHGRMFVKLLFDYFSKEQENNGPLTPVQKVSERVSDALKISRKTVSRIIQESKTGKLLSPKTMASPVKKRPLKSPQKEKNSKLMKTQEDKIVQDLVRCVNFCAIKHKSQRRKDPEETPYINHPIGVANILVEEGKILDRNVIMAAFLHDTVEDTETTFEEIEKEFGKKVTEIVRELTDEKTLPRETRKMLQIENARSSSYEAKLVKLADKLYNLRDLQRCTPRGWSEERVKEYYSWAFMVIDGLRGTNKKMEIELDKVLKKKL